MAGREHHVLRHRKISERPDDLVGYAETKPGAPRTPKPQDIPAIEKNATRARSHLPGDGAQHRCLPGAVRADEADELPVGYGKGDMVDGGDAPEADGNVDRLEDRCGHVRARAPMRRAKPAMP